MLEPDYMRGVLTEKEVQDIEKKLEKIDGKDLKKKAKKSS